MITSYCPDAIAASELIADLAPPRTAFYDMDTPVTLSKLENGEAVPYIPKMGLGAFDLVLSYTGGRALDLLVSQLGARRVAPLYGWVDPEIYHPGAMSPWFEADLSYLGTYSADRQHQLDNLLLTSARLLPDKHFLIAGAMYPNRSDWPTNIRHYDHVAPPDHRAFYSSSPLTLNLTRASMAAMGYCPSGRLFEAAACGAAVLSDWWQGLDSFFTPGEEIMVATSTEDTLQALQFGPGDLSAIAARARQRTLDCHTADLRAERFIQLLERSYSQHPAPQVEAVSLTDGA